METIGKVDLEPGKKANTGAYGPMVTSQIPIPATEVLFSIC